MEAEVRLACVCVLSPRMLHFSLWKHFAVTAA